MDEIKIRIIKTKINQTKIKIIFIILDKSQFTKINTKSKIKTVKFIQSTVLLTNVTKMFESCWKTIMLTSFLEKRIRKPTIQNPIRKRKKRLKTKKTKDV